MKLAEALQERADLNRKTEQLRERINQNAVMQEGVAPVEDPNALLKELADCLGRMEKLIVAINRTNMETMADSEPLTALLARRDVLKLRIGTLHDVVNVASNLSQRSRGDEIRQLAAVDVPALQKEADRLSRDFRRLDNRIQALNWSTELIGLE